MHITPCSRVADVPAELAQAFATMPHYPTSNPDRDNVGGWDPLSTEGPHRSILRLTGYALAGRQGDRSVYLLRFTMNGATVFAAYDVGHTLHLSDYQPAHERTLEAAAIRAAQVLAHLPRPAERATFPTLADVIAGFAGLDEAKVWRHYPAVQVPDGFDCDDVSERFAVFARQNGYVAEVVRLEPTEPVPFLGEHYVTVVDGMAVDWTARQFYNLADDDADWLDPAAIPVPLIYPHATGHPLPGCEKLAAVSASTAAA